MHKNTEGLRLYTNIKTKVQFFNRICFHVHPKLKTLGSVCTSLENTNLV